MCLLSCTERCYAPADILAEKCHREGGWDAVENIIYLDYVLAGWRTASALRSRLVGLEGVSLNVSN